VANADKTAETLPLTHVTDAYSLRSIATTGSLDPEKCPNFREPLLYMFYGRPAYRKNMTVRPSRNTAYAPVCLVVQPDNVVAKRVFPFDTGAFDAGMMEELFHSKMRAVDFGLEADLVSARRLVRLYFGDNRRYFHNRPGPTPSMGTFDFEAKCYDELIRKAAEGDIDERLSTIEIQSDDAVDLAKQVLAIAVPETFLEETSLMKRLEELDIEPLPYMYMDGWRPLDCTSGIYTAVREFYRRPTIKCL
jgi:hypothetical protein